jgi:LacI family repressor for deo operon, udp, cdd, tsx, nupC, and nupG
VGFDNTYISVISDPSITAVSQPQFQIGYMACEVLIERILNPNVTHRQVLLETELIVRESV